MSEKVHLNLDIEQEYKEKLREIAEKNERSMTGQIRHWIKQVKES